MQANSTSDTRAGSTASYQLPRPWALVPASLCLLRGDVVHSISPHVHICREVADGVIRGESKFEQLMVAGHEIAASTAQLVSASRVKAPSSSVHAIPLEDASRSGQCLQMLECTSIIRNGSVCGNQGADRGSPQSWRGHSQDPIRLAPTMLMAALIAHILRLQRQTT